LRGRICPTPSQRGRPARSHMEVRNEIPARRSHRRPDLWARVRHTFRHAHTYDRDALAAQTRRSTATSLAARASTSGGPDTVVAAPARRCDPSPAAPELATRPQRIIGTQIYGGVDKRRTSRLSCKAKRPRFASHRFCDGLFDRFSPIFWPCSSMSPKPRYK
jgi:hypothetical protein